MATRSMASDIKLEAMRRELAMAVHSGTITLLSFSAWAFQGPCVAVLADNRILFLLHNEGSF